MAESADALDSGSSGSNTVCVQVTLSAPPQSLWRQIAPAGRNVSVNIAETFFYYFSLKIFFLYKYITEPMEASSPRRQKGFCRNTEAFSLSFSEKSIILYKHKIISGEVGRFYNNWLLLSY